MTPVSFPRVKSGDLLQATRVGEAVQVGQGCLCMGCKPASEGLWAPDPTFKRLKAEEGGSPGPGVGIHLSRR